MAINLADETYSDAEITDGIGLGRIDSAARLWVRYWPTALATAREYVEAAEVPGLAAEALVGTIAAIAVGHGPREDARSFVVDAVRELGEGEVPPAGEPVLPDVFVSALMTRAFSELPASDQDVLRRDDWTEHGEEVRPSLGALQRDYLTLHVERAEGIPCIQVHNFLSAAVTDPSKTVLSGEAWVHLSSCAVCTEAFHEVVFSNVALDALVAPTALAAPPVPLAPLVEEPVVGVVAEGDVEPMSGEDTVVLSFPTPEPEPVAAAAAVAPLDADDDEDDEAAAAVVVPGRPRRKRRGVLAGIVAVAATIAVVTVVLGNQGNQGDQDKDLAAADVPQQSQQPSSPTPTAYVEPPVTPTDETTGTPVGRVLDELPTDLATDAATGAATAAATPTRSPKPSKAPEPSRTPKPSAAPSTSSPDPEPTPQQPTPSATPTKKPCNPLAHLLGMC